MKVVFIVAYELICKLCLSVLFVLRRTLGLLEFKMNLKEV
jgi:hypothetical protein